MNLRRFKSSFLAVCLLVCTGLAQECEWDQSTDPNQGLDRDFMNAGSIHVLNISDVPDADSCRAACCNDPDCDLALVGYPQDRGPQCMLMRCLVQGRDVCVLQPNSQFNAYRKAVKAEKEETPNEEEKGGDVPHIVPLLGSWEPKINESNNIRCRLPMKVGSCRAAFPKFYYDVANQTCRKFLYGGCESNGNNFDSLDDCEATCSGVTGSVLPDESTPAPPSIKAARMAPAFKTIESEVSATENSTVPPVEKAMSTEDFTELCGVKPDMGPCRAMFTRWYYNRETSSCQSFTYGGCRGNKNNYDSEESCKAACTVTVLPSSKKAVDDDDEVSTEYEDHCTVTPDPGPCRAAFPMFYYDPKTASCQSFMYGGCRGNQNRYTSADDCMKRCGVIACPHGAARNRWTAGIFLFLTLAAISALLLATLVIITLRRRNLSRQSPSISDKEELLPDEQSSVESLTLPESPKPNKA